MLFLNTTLEEIYPSNFAHRKAVFYPAGVMQAGGGRSLTISIPGVSVMNWLKPWQK